MPTVDEELTEIAAIPDVETVRKRKSARRSQYTRLKQTLSKMMLTEPRKIPTRDLERKVAEAKRSSVLLHAMQDRHEEFLSDSADAKQAEEEAGYALQEEYDELVTVAETLLDRCTIHHKATILQEELEGQTSKSISKSTNLSSLKSPC